MLMSTCFGSQPHALSQASAPKTSCQVLDIEAYALQAGYLLRPLASCHISNIDSLSHQCELTG